MTSRRKFLGGAGAVSLLVLAGLWARRGGEAKAATASFRFEKTDAEWRKLLSPEQYRVLRRAGTEKPFTSPLNDEHRHGTFACAGCAQPVYASDAKFDSGTGWPSFYQPLPNAIGEASDRSFLMTRTEVHCANCGGHLGHVFNDGPAPTGKRYCMNGVALSFTPV